MVGRRVLFGTIGVIATIIAIVGVWLPGVPTVPPLIVALWAFSRSSERLHQKVEKLSILKHAMREVHRFERERTIDRRVKLLAMASAWASTLFVAFVMRNTVVTIIVAGAALACTIFMIVAPTRGVIAESTNDELT
ncbi:MAG: YbaN family protein [Candidatus Saccharimonas sp.]